MALTDPELEMLREVLQEDPGADAFVDVGEELIRRGLNGEAVRVLVRGLAADPEPVRGWELLARAAVNDGQYGRALSAFDRLPRTSTQRSDVARVRVLALAGSGQLSRAQEAARAFLAIHPGDPEVTALVERLSAPARPTALRAADPQLTPQRAEAYVRLGRPDRAVRVYRRILQANPGAMGIAGRLRELLDLPIEAELQREVEATLPGEVALPALNMPSPALGESVSFALPVYGATGELPAAPGPRVSGPALSAEDAPMPRVAPAAQPAALFPIEPDTHLDEITDTEGQKPITLTEDISHLDVLKEEVFAIAAKVIAERAGRGGVPEVADVSELELDAPGFESTPVPRHEEDLEETVLVSEIPADILRGATAEQVLAEVERARKKRSLLRK